MDNNKDELNELLNRASEDSNDINNENEVNVEENNEEDLKVNVDNNFSGYFHERDRLEQNNIVDEVKTSFMEYSMSVIKSRALPDLRDGLKPVHRRILWSMYESGYTPYKPHRKSAKTVGEVMGNYHPHGDSSIYEAMVRLAQDFNQRYMLIDGHGNFGNIEGDGAAAMRYTESRLAKISLELLKDINKETVDMDDNFDATRKEPLVLPSRFPNILVNGSMGIAVGMATNIPPHNLGEVIDGCIAYIDNPEIDTMGLMEYVKGLSLKELIQNKLKVKVVANLPYYITTPIVMKLLEDKLNIEQITVMVQKEVGERFTATPNGKEYGAITVSINYYTEPSIVIDVPRDNFNPVPDVDSCVVNLKVKKEYIKLKDEKTFFKVIKAAFSQRRKNIGNSLTGVGKSKQEIKQMLDELEINSNLRAENLSLETFAKIADYIA